MTPEVEPGARCGEERSLLVQVARACCWEERPPVTVAWSLLVGREGHFARTIPAWSESGLPSSRTLMRLGGCWGRGEVLLGVGGG